MDDPANLLRNTDQATLNRVASDVAKVNPTATTVDSVERLVRHHNDNRTVGLYRARCSSDGTEWSSVVKVVDVKALPIDGVQWLSPETEEAVYRSNLFSDLQVAFRPVRCHGVSTLAEGIQGLWLEDLTSAPQPPWSVDQYLTAARHLGQFDGIQCIDESPMSGIDVPSCNFVHRWVGLRFQDDIATMAEGTSGSSVARALSSAAISKLERVAAVIPDFLTQAQSMPVFLTHGDSHARNMFPLDGETVAVDWSGLAREPLGTGVGALIGSGLTWTLNEYEMVLNNLDRLFDAYVEGLRESGCNGDIRSVRKGMFCQLGAYLLIIATFPLQLDSPEIEDRRAHYETRIGVSLEEAPDRIADAMPKLTGYLDELVALTRDSLHQIG